LAILERLTRPAVAVVVLLGLAGAAPQQPPGRPGPTVDENDDDDNAGRRARVNATARLALPAGAVEVVYPLLPADGPDAESMAALADGEVLELTRSMALKLKTEVELRFPGVTARAENVSPGYPGVYSLWLRRRADGWSLLFNREPDIWGTMRDPAADLGETPVAHRRVGAAAAKPTLEATLEATNGGGQLTIAWGSDRFTADFDAGPGMARSSSASP
jgi:hypothetical protein